MTEQEGEVIDLWDMQLEESQLLSIFKDKSQKVYSLSISSFGLKKIVHLFRSIQQKFLVNSSGTNSKYCAFSRIGIKGCKFLSKMVLPELQQLDIGMNEAESVGMMHLSKAKWDNLLTLDGNMIRVTSHITATRWPEISRMSLDSNKMTYEELLRLILADLRGLACLQIYNNGLERSEMKKYGYLMRFKYWKLRIIADQIYS